MATQSVTALHKAIRKGNLDEINALVAAGHFLNARDAGGDTPLHVAVDCGVLAAIRLLLAHSAQFALRNNKGHTALQLAVIESKDAIVHALLQGCPNPVHAVNYPDNEGWTAVHHAAARCDLPILRLLLAAGGSATKLTPRGEEPSSLCRIDGKSGECLELLRAHGALH